MSWSGMFILFCAFLRSLANKSVTQLVVLNTTFGPSIQSFLMRLSFPKSNSFVTYLRLYLSVLYLEDPEDPAYVYPHDHELCIPTNRQGIHRPFHEMSQLT
ncbi:hypothetical protein BDV10DRAFT_34078 [Aspergillus recurvatus]